MKGKAKKAAVKAAALPTKLLVTVRYHGKWHAAAILGLKGHKVHVKYVPEKGKGPRMEWLERTLRPFEKEEKKAVKAA